MTGTDLVEGAAMLSSLMLLAGVLFAFYRIARGPSLPDRVVALDMLSMLLVGFSGVAAVAFDEAAFLEVAITLALLAFIATAALARYIERRARSERDGGPR